MRMLSLGVAVVVAALTVSVGAQELKPEDRRARGPRSNRATTSCRCRMRIGLRPKAPNERRPADRGLGRDLDQRRRWSPAASCAIGSARDADAILKLSYLDPAVRRALFASGRRAGADRPPRRRRRRIRAGSRSRSRSRSSADRAATACGSSATWRCAKASRSPARSWRCSGSVRIDGEVGRPGRRGARLGGSRPQGGRARRHRQRRRAGASGTGARRARRRDRGVAAGREHRMPRLAPWLGGLGVLSFVRRLRWRRSAADRHHVPAVPAADLRVAGDGRGAGPGRALGGSESATTRSRPR